MDQHTSDARNWLDRRYGRNRAGGYLAHQPIHGLKTDRSEPNQILRLARTYRLLEWLSSLEFETVLDVGGGEGYLSALIRDVCGASCVHSSDLSTEACERAREIFSIQGVAADSAMLPFHDDAYDVVICSEVIEHLSRPVLAIRELSRVARKFVIVSTAEFCPVGETERTLRALTLDTSYPHAEMNWFTAEDFRAVLGDGVTMSSQFRAFGHSLPEVCGSREQEESVLTGLTATATLDVDHTGVVVVCSKLAVPVSLPPPVRGKRRQEILNRLLDPPTQVVSIPAALPEESLVERLHCLRCRRGVRIATDETGLVCTGCQVRYELSCGVPKMFVERSGNESAALRDATCIAELADGDSTRERRVRRVVQRLHHDDRGRRGAVTQWIAGQLLRLVWLWHREERLTRKGARVVRRLTGSRAARDTTSLVPSAVASQVVDVGRGSTFSGPANDSRG